MAESAGNPWQVKFNNGDVTLVRQVLDVLYIIILEHAL